MYRCIPGYVERPPLIARKPTLHADIVPPRFHWKKACKELSNTSRMSWETRHHKEREHDAAIAAVVVLPAYFMIALICSCHS